MDPARLAHIAEVASRVAPRAEAARQLGIGTSTLREHLRSYKALSMSPIAQDTRGSAPPPETFTPGPDHDRKLILLQDEVADLKRRLKEAHRDGAGWESIREGVLGLVTPPLRPRLGPAERGAAGKGGRTVIIHLSDLHCGEFVDRDEMGGINSYSIDVFRKRMARLAHKAKALMTEHWKGDPPERIILIFGGDLITGEIHNELAKTNDALSAPAVRLCAEVLAGIVEGLAEVAPVDIYSVPGNHGRLTLKPESKGFASNSLDTLIGNVVEMMMRGRTDVRFFYPKSGDALIDVYGWVFCVVHGDRTGSKGGMGFLGSLAPIIRGMHKVHAYYASQGIGIHFVMQGHLHTTGYFPSLGISNGSTIGPSEYSRDLRARPEGASQNFIVVEPQLGIIDFKELKLGEPSEGSIYGGAL